MVLPLLSGMFGGGGGGAKPALGLFGNLADPNHKADLRRALISAGAAMMSAGPQNSVFGTLGAGLGAGVGAYDEGAEKRLKEALFGLQTRGVDLQERGLGLQERRLGLEEQDFEHKQAQDAAWNGYLNLLAGGSPGGQQTAELQPVFAATAQKYGLPPEYLARTAQLESSFNPRARNPNSSAKGLFQFINSTAKQYGLSDPMDPLASTEAAAKLAADNRRLLTERLGREPTSAELYLAHQQGGPGAARLLANPNQKAALVVGKNAVRLNGGREDMTAGEFANLWINKFNSIGGNDGQQPVQVADASGGMSPDLMRALSAMPRAQAAQFLASQAIKGPEKPSAMQEKVDMLVATGVPLPIAQGIAAGRYSVSVNPMDNSRQVIDIAIGQPIGQLPPEGQQGPIPAGGGADTIAASDNRGALPRDIDASAGVGPAALGARMVNTISDAFGQGLAYPKSNEAAEGIRNLQVRTTTTLQEDVAGRPSNWLMQKIEELTVAPESIFMGEGRAKQRFDQMRSLLRNEIKRINENVIGQPSQWKPEQIQKARLSRDKLEALLTDYDQVVQSLDQKGGGGGGRKPLSDIFGGAP